MSKTFRNIILLSIVLISVIMHFEHFSKDLMSIHVWRQTQTQSTTINFYEEDMNIFNPRRNDRGDTEGLFRMEFPLMQWMVAFLYKVFGNHLIITRIFMFLIGLLSVLGLYKLLDALFHNTILSVMGAWAFNFSPVFYYYTINPLPDNFALCCSIWGLALFFIWIHNKNIWYLLFSSLLFGIGAMCKLPFIIYYVVPLSYFLHAAIKHGIKVQLLFQSIGAFIFSLLPVAWYLAVIPDWDGNIIIKGMLNSNESVNEILDYYQHTLISTLPELLLNYGSVLFFLAGFYFLFKEKAYRNPRFILLLSLSIACLIYYLFEANAIAKIHDYYLFPFYPLLFILVAFGAFKLYSYKIGFFKYLTVLLLLILPVTCYVRMHVRWNPESPGFNKDLLVYKTELREAVPKDALVVAGNDLSHFIFFYYIDKKGWAFDTDMLTPEKLKSTIEKGAKYLYTDSEAVLNQSEITNYLDKLIFEGGTIKVYSLKDPASNK